MIRQNIILGDFTYIVDLYKANSDLVGNHYDEFVILKNGKFMNNIMYDNDIFFIKKSIIEKCIISNDGVETIDKDLLGKLIAFPITNNHITMSYSSDYSKFNENYIDSTFNLNNDGDIIQMFDETLNNVSSVLCDKIRIWLPITNSKLTSLIHITNLINDIRFHYICENLTNYETNSNSEMYIGNDIYSEYIDIWIPNVEDLFKPSSHYIKETYNSTQIKQKIIFKESADEYITLYPKIYFDVIRDCVVKKFSIEAFRTYNIDNQYIIKLIDKNTDSVICDISNFWNVMSLNYEYEEIISDDCDLYLTIYDSDNNVLQEYNIYQSEIKYIQKDNNNYIYHSTFLLILPFFIDNQTFLDSQITSKTFFDIGETISNNTLANPIIVSLCPFSKIDDVTKTYVKSENYVENSDIFTLSKDIKLNICFNFNKQTTDGYSNYGKYVLSSKFTCSGIDSNNLQQYFLSKNKLSLYDYISDNIIDNGEYDSDIFNEKIKKCGFVIEIGSNINFNEVLYEYVTNLDIVDASSEIIKDYDFVINLNVGEMMWNSYPDTLVIRVKFVDKVSYTIIESNPLFITKENFKYLINGTKDSIVNRIVLIDNNQGEDQIAFQIYNEINDNMAFNFIDKINCTVISKETETNTITNGKNSQKIVFKPVFYKVKDLQNLKLKSGITQNIALNLSEIISKADTFKITINGIEFPEVARNDGYVIFRVNSQELSSSSGQYNLLDQDDEYISDGTWYTY